MVAGGGGRLPATERGPMHSTRHRLPATIDTDASNVGISVVVSQVQDGQGRVMAYYSKTLTTADII